jgi:hypothetical protein
MGREAYRRTLLGEGTTSSELAISLEGSKAGPRQGFDSCPRIKQSKGCLKSGPVQGQGSSHFLETPLDIFEAKGGVDSGIPPEGGIEASAPIVQSRDPYDNSLAFWRAPPRPPTDPYRTGHGLPLEFPASNSPGIIETRPSRVVRCFHPSSLPKGCVRVDR